MANALMGGVLIGLAVSMMMLFNGRVTGISGILGGVINPSKSDLGWRLSFLIGLLLGGFALRILNPGVLIQVSSAQWGDYVFAGVLVGFGTLLGNGCTSGHGVCGISRISVRSIMATVTFITFGMISLFIFKMVKGSV
jgi:uncharacterized membrane protein YedE/YeeE